MERKTNNKTTRKCDSCQKPIDLGQDLFTTEKCTNGPRGIVPLGKINYFCSEQCVKDWFTVDPAEGLQEVGFRVP